MDASILPEFVSWMRTFSSCAKILYGKVSLVDPGSSLNIFHELGFSVPVFSMVLDVVIPDGILDEMRSGFVRYVV